MQNFVLEIRQSIYSITYSAADEFCLFVCDFWSVSAGRSLMDKVKALMGDYPQ